LPTSPVVPCSAPVSGKIGVWSKTDSMIEFADFTVTPTSK